MTRKCPFKKHAGGAACPCGCLGKKFCKVPLPFTLEPIVPGNEFNKRILSTARKWGKKKAFRTIGRIKENYEGDDDVDEDLDIEGENWFPVNFCFLVPTKNGKEYAHQTAGVCCMHHKIRGKIIEIPLKPCQERVLNKLFSRLEQSSQFHLPFHRVVARVISYLKLPVAPAERRYDLTRKRDFNDAVNCEIAMAEAFGASKDVSHEAWQWVDVVDGNFERFPELERYEGQRILMIYPNSD